MSKKAMLVTITFVTRVIVDSNASEEAIAAAVLLQLQDKMNNNEIYENIEAIHPDRECPYGSLNNENIN